MNKVLYILILLLCFSYLLFYVINVIKQWKSNSKEPFFVDYASIVESPDKTNIITRVIPNPTVIYPGHKKIKIHYGYSSAELDEGNHNVLIDMEPHLRNIDHHFDLVISTNKVQYSTPHQLHTPAWSFILGESSNWSIPDLLQRNYYPKEKFCAYMYSNCNTNMNGVKLRETFFEKLHSKRHVDALGNCKHNTDTPHTRYTSNWLDLAVDTFKPYKFVIAFENSNDVQGYVSEKIVLPLLAGAIPIYSGDSSVKEMFNPGCFIYLNDFSSPDECINYVLHVDKNPALYQQYIQCPIISKQKLVEYAGWYYGTRNFYNPLFQAFPLLKRDPYISMVPDHKQHNPSKPIKIINLERSRDRWKDIQEKFNSKPLLQHTYERFPAVDGRKYASLYQQFVDTSWLGENLKFNPGQIGIYMTTMEICKTLVHDEQNDYYLHLEDDVILNDYFTSLDDLKKEIAAVPADWDIIFAGSNERYCKVKPENPQHNYAKIGLSCMPGNFAVIIRKRGAQYLLNFAFPMQQPIDEFYRNNSANLNMYALIPRLVTVEHDNVSTIGTT